MKKWILAMMTALFAFTANAATVTLTPENTLTLREQVSDDDVVSRLILQITESDQKTLYLYISSPGGSIIAGNALINTLKATDKKIVCIADFAASMAFSIFQACTVRLSTESAILMQHQGSTQVKGNLTQVKNEVAILEKLTNKLNSDDAKRIGITLEAFQAKVHDDWWLYADEIVKEHVSDASTLVKCSVALSKQREIQTVNSLFGSVTLTWSGCPLAAYPISVAQGRRQGVDDRDYKEWLQSLFLDRDWKTHQVVKK